MKTLKMKLIIIIILVLPFQLMAGEFHLASMDEVSQYNLKSDGVGSICSDYVKNLNHFKDAPPMVYGRKLHKEMTDFSKPDWKILDLKKHEYLAYEISDFRANLYSSHIKKGFLNKHIATSRKQTQDWLSQERLIMQISHLKIDEGGTKVWLLKWGHKRTSDGNISDPSYASPGTGTLYVIEKNNNKWKIDEEGSKKLRLFGGNIFLYKDFIFSDSWRGNPSKKTAIISVLRMKYQKDTQLPYSYWICSINYKE